MGKTSISSITIENLDAVEKLKELDESECYREIPENLLANTVSTTTIRTFKVIIIG